MTLNQAVARHAHIDETEVAKYVIDATKDVFSKLVMMELHDNYPLREPVTKFQCSITGMVGLAGIYTGILSIHCPQRFAMRMTSNMLGTPVDAVGDDVNDALGEIANMLGGHIKMMFSNGGLDINLSLPTVISGEEYTLNAMADNDCIILPFDYEGERFLVGLKLKKEK